MLVALARRLCTLLALACLVAAVACTVAPVPIAVHGDRVVVSNLTEESWQGVELTVNRYYRARFDRLPSGGRIDAPLRRFQGGFGRYFDVRREQVTAVRVTATNAAGSPVVLEWTAPTQ